MRCFTLIILQGLKARLLLAFGLFAVPVLTMQAEGIVLKSDAAKALHFKAHERYEQFVNTGSLSNLDEAISLWGRAWDMRGVDVDLEQKIAYNLFCSYAVRSERKNSIDDCLLAVRNYLKYKAAVARMPPEDVDIRNGGNGAAQALRIMYAQVLPSAERGNVDAMEALARMYESGDGVELSVDEAFKWMQLAASSNSVVALSSLGSMYALGKGTPKSDDKAIECWKRAAEGGYAVGMTNLGNYYTRKKNYAEALRWLQKAVDKNEPFAMYTLGDLYWRGFGVEQSHAKAADWFERSISGGCVGAMVDLANMHQDKSWSEHSESKAKTLYSEAAKNGSVTAMYNLGVMLYNGTGGNKDHEKALKLFARASKLGLPRAQYMYGCMLWHGEGGVDANENAAKGWFRRAARLGDPDAKKYLRQINDTGGVGEGSSSGTNTGNVKNKEGRENLPPSDKYLTDNPLVGFGRGLSSVVTSPGNIIWGAGAGFVRFEMESPILGLGTAIGVLGGCGVCVSDIVLGCADMMTFGWLGNRYFYNENSWSITPWFFTHDWFK